VPVIRLPEACVGIEGLRRRSPAEGIAAEMGILLQSSGVAPRHDSNARRSHQVIVHRDRRWARRATSGEQEKHLRIMAGVGQDDPVNLALVRLPEDAPIFPSFAGQGFDFTQPRDSRGVTKQFGTRARKLGFARLRFHDLRGTHETMLLDAGRCRCPGSRRRCPLRP